MSVKVSQQQLLLLAFDEDYQALHLARQDLQNLELLKNGFTANGKFQKRDALMKAVSIYDLVLKNINSSSMGIERNRSKIDEVRKELEALKEKIKDNDALRDVSRDIAMLIKSISTPAALIAFTLSGGMAAAIPASARVVGDALAEKLEEKNKPAEAEHPDAAIEIKFDIENYSFSGEEHTWFKECRDVMDELEDKEPLVKLISSLRENDFKAYKLAIVAAVYENTIELLTRKKEDIEKKFKDLKVSHVWLSVLDSTVRNIPTLVINAAKGVAGVAGKALTQLGEDKGTKRALEEAKGSDEAPLLLEEGNEGSGEKTTPPPKKQAVPKKEGGDGTS